MLFVINYRITSKKRPTDKPRHVKKIRPADLTDMKNV